MTHTKRFGRGSKTPAVKAPELTYLPDCADLPIDAPIGHPHLVDPESVSDRFVPQDLTVADVVVTTLFKYQPEALTAFLDLDRPKVHYIQAGRRSRLDICIKREGRVVTLGFLNEQEVGGWDVQCQCRINGKATEMWTRMSKGVFAFTILMHRPWTQHPGQEVEWFSGLSHGRNI